MRVHAHTHVHARVHAHDVHASMHAHTRARARTRAHTHTHTHTHTELYPYLTPALVGGVGGQCHILAALPWERGTVLIVQEAGWVQKLFPPPGFKPWTFKSIASHYTKYTTLPHRPPPHTCTNTHNTNHRLIHYELASVQEHVLYSFIHLVVCLTTGPKRALHIVQSRASSFK